MSATPLKAWVRAATDLLYPRTCGGCDEPVRDGDRYLCWECRSSLPLIAHPFCSICGNPLEGRVDHGYVCFLCAGERPHFDRARCASRFHGVLPKLAHDFKYHQAVWLQEDLAEVLEACWKTHYDGEQVDAVVPVPLYPARQRSRGYNQAALLAGALARRLHVPYRPGWLRRVRDTETQTHLTAPQRASNVQTAFKSGRPAALAGRKILLVDDVMTTGATVNECARALKQAGAAGVLVLTLARGG